MGDDPNQAGNSRRWIIARGRGQPAPARHRLDRPLPDPPPRPDTDIDETLGALTDLVRAGQGPLHRLARRSRPRRSSRRSGSPSAAAASASSASSRRTRSSCAASRRDVLPTCQRYGMGVIPWSPLAGGWLSGKLAQGRRRPAPVARAPSASRSATTSSMPGNQRKLEAADALGAARRGGRHAADPPGAGVRASRHPAVTAAIIGPRTMEQLESQLGARRRRRSTTTCSTASTRSSRPARTSTRPTRAGRTRRCHEARAGRR